VLDFDFCIDIVQKSIIKDLDEQFVVQILLIDRVKRSQLEFEHGIFTPLFCHCSLVLRKASAAPAIFKMI
jgi:hypothetical protein